MKSTIVYVVVIVVGVVIGSAPSYAQSSERPGPAVEIFAGHAGFVDDSTIPHTVLGGAGRFYFSPRLAAGPEFAYMWGPRLDRDIVLTGNLTWDLLRENGSNPPIVVPFIVGGVGAFRHNEGFGGHTETTFTAGGGTRVRINDRLYGLVDFRIGWELHYRITGGIGVKLSK